MIGTTAQIESCCAVRVSVTRDEMAVMTATAISPKSGAPARKRMSQPPVTTWETTFASVKIASSAMNRPPLIHVSSTAGSNAARILPASNCHRRTGVASSGSSVWLLFSPMML